MNFKNHFYFKKQTNLKIINFISKILILLILLKNYNPKEILSIKINKRYIIILKGNL